MSAQANQAAPADLTADQVQDVYVNYLFATPFFGKLAEFGIQPQNESEAAALLQAGLSAVDNPPQDLVDVLVASNVKQASAQNRFAALAPQAETVEDVLKQAGLVQTSDEDYLQAAVELLQHDVVKQAADLQVGALLAAQLQEFEQADAQ